IAPPAPPSARGCARCCASTAASTSPTSLPPDAEQFQPRAVRARGVDEARGRGAEYELVNLARLAAHLQAAAFFVDGEHDALLEGAAEVRDARTRAHAREGT